MLSRLKRLVLPKRAGIYRIKRGPASGIRMMLNLQSQFQLYLGLYEQQLHPFIRKMVRPGVKCFDVGGSDAYDALMFAKLSQGPVVSFECSGDCEQRMIENIKLNPYTDIQIMRAFIGDKDGNGYLTLDTAAKRYFMPDVVKLDIEGAETDALRGGMGILKDRKPHVIIEVHGKNREDECLAILQDNGYTPVILNQSRWRKEHRPLAHNRWVVAYGQEARVESSRLSASR